MRNCIFSNRLFALCLSFLLVGLMSHRQACGKDEVDKPGKTKPAPDATKDSPDGLDKEAKEEKEDDDGGGFGAARKPAKKSPSSRRSSKDKEEEEEEETKEPVDKEKAKLAKLLEKRLGRKEEGYFVFQLIERKLVERAPEEEGAEEEPPVASNQRNRRKSPFEYVENVEFHVIEGRDNTVEFLVDYLSEYPPPDKKSRSRKPKDGPIELPPPQRDFRFFRSFPEGAEGNQAAQYLRDQAKAHYEEQQAKRNYGK